MIAYHKEQEVTKAINRDSPSASTNHLLSYNLISFAEYTPVSNLKSYHLSNLYVEGV